MAEIRGRFVLILDAMASWQTREKARAAMKIPITDIQPDQWYNVKDTVLLYERAIANVNGSLSLKVTGARIMPILKKHTKELDVFANPHQLFMAFNALFLSDNRGADAGHFRAIKMGANFAVMEDTSPHLPEFHLGALEGAVGIFPGYSLTSSKTVELGKGKKVYEIQWKNNID